MQHKPRHEPFVPHLVTHCCRHTNSQCMASHAPGFHGAKKIDAILRLSSHVALQAFPSACTATQHRAYRLRQNPQPGCVGRKPTRNCTYVHTYAYAYAIISLHQLSIPAYGLIRTMQPTASSLASQPQASSARINPWAEPASAVRIRTYNALLPLDQGSSTTGTGFR